MLKENQKVKVRWNPFTKKYYESFGYQYTKMNDEFEVNIKDLQHGSHAKVVVICDFCGEEITKTYKDYWAQHEGGDCCEECEGKKSSAILSTKYTTEDRKNFMIKGLENKYGVQNPSNIPGVAEKIKQTNLERYGVECVINLFDHHEIGKLSWSEESRQKRKDTNLERYGHECHLSAPIIRKKINDSYFKNGTIKTSSQQIAIYNLLLKQYGNCELNLPCGIYSLDCVVNIEGVLIDMEYDGQYWHKDRQTHDDIRDNFVQSQNYKILRILGAHSIPSYEELSEKINILLTTDSLIEKIIMV